MGMVSLNGSAEVQQLNATECAPSDNGLTGGLSTIEEEADDDREMVGPVVPTARKRRVMTVMALTTTDGVANCLTQKEVLHLINLSMPHAEIGQRAGILACTALSRDV